MTLQGIFSGTPRLVRAPLGRDSNRNTPHGQMSYILYKSQAYDRVPNAGYSAITAYLPSARILRGILRICRLAQR